MLHPSLTFQGLFLLLTFRASAAMLGPIRQHPPPSPSSQDSESMSNSDPSVDRPRPSSSSLCLLSPLLLLLLLLLPADAEGFARRPTDGLMKLCPPGGQSFAAAWEITCGMRRKKRSAEIAETEDKKPNPGEENLLAREDGNPAPKNLWITLREFLFGIQETEPSARVLSRKERTTAEEQIGAKLSNTEAEPGQQKHLYRAPSMTEMMLFCCRFGCSLRDLMPYCDPFGEWDS